MLGKVKPPSPLAAPRVPVISARRGERIMVTYPNSAPTHSRRLNDGDWVTEITLTVDEAREMYEALRSALYISG